jgi:hypothetical protein
LNNEQLLSFIKAQALVAGQTVYNADTACLSTQQAKAKAILLNAHDRFKEALQLQSQLSAMPATTRKEAGFSHVALAFKLHHPTDTKELQRLDLS